MQINKNKRKHNKKVYINRKNQIKIKKKEYNLIKERFLLQMKEQK